MMKNSKIIAVDFDGTLCENSYPRIGKTKLKTVEALLREQRDGARIILWTCRKGKLLDDAVSWCKEHKIELSTVNSNLPDIIKKFGGDTRKIFANEYWDDRAINEKDITIIYHM